LNDLETPTTPLESELSYPNTTADDIEARLLSVKGIENAFAFKKIFLNLHKTVVVAVNQVILTFHHFTNS